MRHQMHISHLQFPRHLHHHCALPSDAPMGPDVKSTECVLERFGRERVANKLRDPVPGTIAEETSDESFWR